MKEYKAMLTEYDAEKKVKEDKKKSFIAEKKK